MPHRCILNETHVMVSEANHRTQPGISPVKQRKTEHSPGSSRDSGCVLGYAGYICITVCFCYNE